MADHWIVAAEGADRTDLPHHYDRDCAETHAADSAGHVRPVNESVIDDDTPRCSECDPLASASGESTDEPSGSDGEREDADTEYLVENGRCPWCIAGNADDPYEGDHVGQHASSAHPEAWAEYTDE